VPANRNVNRSVMCAIGKEGLIAHECVRGSYNAERFLNFINRYLVPHFKTYQTSVLIMPGFIRLQMLKRPCVKMA